MPVTTKTLSLKHPPQTIKCLKPLYKKLDCCIAMRLIACKHYKVNPSPNHLEMLWIVHKYKCHDNHKYSSKFLVLLPSQLDQSQKFALWVRTKALEL